MGVIILTGLDPTKIINALHSINENYEDIKKRFVSNPFGNGQASIFFTILKEYPSSFLQGTI